MNIEDPTGSISNANSYKASNASSAPCPAADDVLLHLSQLLARSLSRLTDDITLLLEKLSHHSLVIAAQDGDDVLASDTEQVRRALIASGYRLANELRKLAPLHSTYDRSLPLNRGGEQSAKVVDIQRILGTIRLRLKNQP